MVKTIWRCGTSKRSVSRIHSPHSSTRLAWHEGQNPRVLQENIRRCSARQSGQRIRAALRSPHDSATIHEGEPGTRIAAVKILLHDVLDDRPEIAALIRFAPEDCKARRPSRNAPRIPRRSARNDGKAPGKGRSAPDDEGDRFPQWREKSLKKRAIIENGTTSPWKEAMTARRKGE
jgi:hypothetical protein